MLRDLLLCRPPPPADPQDEERASDDPPQTAQRSHRPCEGACAIPSQLRPELVHEGSYTSLAAQHLFSSRQPDSYSVSPCYVSERRGFCGRFWKRQHGPVLKIELYLRLLLPMEEIVVGACRSRAYHRQKAKELQDPFHSSTASSASSSSSSRVSRMQVFMS